MGIDLFGSHESTSLTFLQLSYTEAESGLKGGDRTFWLIFFRERFSSTILADRNALIGNLDFRAGRASRT
jgi:hypothetical protein